MKKFILFLLVFSFSAFAEPLTTPAGVPKNFHVYDLHGNTFVDLAAHGCSSARYYLSPTHPKYDAIVSVLLAAQTSNKKIVIRFEDCTPQDQGKIIGVYYL
ncbi:hypothetical protein KDD30_15215 [Photobacterium sp. GJ3]|uniref:hypothetical protein n=1 Tax=Photobacterium sp. GJ3 TaxID=2829502 RepID=UPI001B8D099B|nr:hypothetical protein [Photobacterium sp. GJ3]QUJ67367.1 hypothetical protein KDD30_15215 [Photobacterium sp. GJ3]